jgi:UDP-GlcNAc:undecaprenyl-phosphate GlcNAc-1-phosphate transferase
MLLIGISTMIVAMAVTWVVTPGVVKLAEYLGAVDQPALRKSHSAPTPRIGGLAVFAGFVAGLAFAAFVSGDLLTIPRPGVYWRGLADDLRGLSFRWKFAAQIVAALYVWNCGFRIEEVTHPLGGILDLGVFSLPLTLLWVVGITNAVNLIDGLDGLACGIALITTLAVGVISFAGGQVGTTAASIALAGALIGFLRYNFNPARIFLGDSGSMFLGFVLAVSSVRGSQKGPTVVAVVVPLLVLGLPLLDTTMTVARRIYRLQSGGKQAGGSVMRYVLTNFHQVFTADRGHIHHRLVDLGLSHRNTVLCLYGVGGLFALAAFAVVLLKSIWIASLLVGVLGSLLATFIFLLYVRIRRVDSGRTDVEAGQAPDGSDEAEAATKPAGPWSASSGVRQFRSR